MIEEWKDIKDYEGLYQISNFGRVKSLSRIVKLRYDTLTKERILTPGEFKNTRYNTQTMRLSKNKIGKTYKYATMVWDHFGDKPRNGHKLQVDHIDNNPKNNHISNLQLLTNRENCSKDIDKTKTTSKYIGVHFNRGKWQTEISVGGKRICLGRFTTEEEAHNAYQEKLKEINSKT